MTKASGTAVFNMTNAAKMRVAYQAISNGFNTILNRTGDTGQVNWTTNTFVTQYEVFSFGDTTPPTNAPLFIRVDYAPTLGGGISFTIGTGTNGAGVITGSLLTAAQGTVLSNPNANPSTNWWAAGDTTQGWFTFMCNILPGSTTSANTPDNAAGIVIERTRDADGTPNALGFTTWKWLATSTAQTANNGTFGGVYARYNDTTQTQPAVSYDNAIAAPITVNPSLLGPNSVGILPAMTHIGETLQGTSKALAFAFPADVPKQQPITVTNYAQPMTYLPMGNSVINWQPYMSSVSTVGVRQLTPCIRWE